MTTTKHSPAPWAYEYSPYRRGSGNRVSDAVDDEIPAYEIFDAEGTKLFDTNEDMAAEIQEANARLATAAPALLVALKGMLEVFVDADQLADFEDMETVKAARTAIAEAEAFGMPPIVFEADETVEA